MPDRSTVSDLVQTLALPFARIAVEVNQGIVRRADWEETILNEDDRVEIVYFVGGGGVGEADGQLHKRVAMGVQLLTNS